MEPLTVQTTDPCVTCDGAGWLTNGQYCDCGYGSWLEVSEELWLQYEAGLLDHGSVSSYNERGDIDNSSVQEESVYLPGDFPWMVDTMR